MRLSLRTNRNPSSHRYRTFLFRWDDCLRRFQIRFFCRLGRLVSRLLRRLLWSELPASDRRRLYRVLAPLLSDLILAHRILAPRIVGDRVGRNQAAGMSALVSTAAETTKAAPVAE